MTDLTVNLYNKSKVCLFSNFTLLKTANFLLALIHTSCICADQSSAEDNYSPKCL